MSFVKDKTSLENFENHIKNKKQWRDNLIKKIVCLRSDKNASLTAPQSVQSSPNKITVVKRSTVIMTEGPFDSPMKRSSVVVKNERSGSLVLEDRFDLQSPALSTRSSRIIVGVAGSIPASPQGNDSPPIKIKKDKPARLMSSGFSFSQMKMSASDKSPLYERQKEKIERKLQQDRQELNLQLNLHKVKSSENEEVPGSASLKNKASHTTRTSVKVQSASTKGGLWPTLESLDSSPKGVKTARESIIRSSLSMADPMIKMCKQLGLDRIYSEKDVRLVSLDGRVCGPIQSLSSLTSLPGVMSEINRASPIEKTRRPGSVHNIHVKIPGNNTAR